MTAATEAGDRRLKILFLDSTTFLKREMLNALRRRADVHLLTAAIPARPPAAGAAAVFEQLRPLLPAVVVSLNESGFDYEGVLFDLIASTGSYFVNWYYDDPRYDYFFFNRRVCRSDRRLDFVTEHSHLPHLLGLGYAAHFLPLGTDPAYFSAAGEAPYERDIAFVGNSTLGLLDSIVSPALHAELERRSGLIAECKELYYGNPRASVWDYLVNNQERWADGMTVDRNQFMFAVEWMVGYLYRRDFVVGLDKAFGDRFTCFGDAGWEQFIEPRHVSPNACYYDNLCRYYRTTRVNININRIQTRTSFTQRVFDAKASGAFLLTDHRQMNEQFFAVGGPDRELVEYGSLEECVELIRYFLSHDEERRQIAGSGVGRVAAEHTYANRLQAILDICAAAWGWS
jgi:spore maturation protein CgeB